MQFIVKNKQAQTTNPQPVKDIKDTNQVPSATTVRDTIGKSIPQEKQQEVIEKGNGKEEPVQFRQELFTKSDVLRMLKANNEMEVRNRVKMVRDTLDAILDTGGNEISK